MKKNKDSISVVWEVDDGYCGGSAPQHTRIFLTEIHDCESCEDAVAMVEQAIEYDFRNHANPSYDLEKIRKQVEEVWSQKQTA